jgi:hypothetical protein
MFLLDSFVFIQAQSQNIAQPDSLSGKFRAARFVKSNKTAPCQPWSSRIQAISSWDIGVKIKIRSRGYGFWVVRTIWEQVFDESSRTNSEFIFWGIEQVVSSELRSISMCLTL